MTVVKIVGVLVGAFLLLMWGFILPSQAADEGLVGVIALLGVAVCGGAAFMAIRGLLRSERRRREVDH